LAPELSLLQVAQSARSLHSQRKGKQRLAPPFQLLASERLSPPLHSLSQQPRSVVSDNRTLLSLQLQLLASASRPELVSVLLLHRVVRGSQAFPLRREVLELLLLQSASALKLHLELLLPLLRWAHLRLAALQLPAGSVLPDLVLRRKLSNRLLVAFKVNNSTFKNRTSVMDWSIQCVQTWGIRVLKANVFFVTSRARQGPPSNQLSAPLSQLLQAVWRLSDSRPAPSRSLLPLCLHLASLIQPWRLFSCSHRPSGLRLLVLAPLPPQPPANR
jgi:hypothetical protein